MLLLLMWSIDTSPEMRLLTHIDSNKKKQHLIPPLFLPFFGVESGEPDLWRFVFNLH